MSTPAVRGAGDLVRSSAVVATGTLLSRITGLLRVAVIAYAIGRASLADTYNLANSTPNIVYELVLGGVLTATLVPLFVDALKRDDDRAISSVFTVALVGLAAVTVVAIVAAPWLARFYTLRVDEAQRADQEELATFFIRWFLPQMLFYAFTALAGALLNASRRFAAAAYAPVLNNVVVICTFLAFVRLTGEPRSEWVSVQSILDDTGLKILLGLGTTAGIVAMALVLVPAVARAGVALRPVFEPRNPMVLRMLRLSGWTVGYVVANQVAYSIVLVLAAGEPGGVAAYAYAFIFFQLPHGLLAVSIMTTVTPELARHAADGDPVAFRLEFSRGLRYLAIVLFPAAAAYLVLAQPLVGILARGAFGPDDVVVTGDVLQLFALGLVPFSAYLYALRGFYALEDTRTPFFVNVFENGVNIVLALLLTPRLGVQGLALAYSVAYLAAAVVALVLLHRRVGSLTGPRTWATAVRATVGSLVLAVVAAPLAGLFDPDSGSSAFAAVVVAGAAGLAVYLVVLHLLRVREVRDLAAVLRRRPARRASEVPR